MPILYILCGPSASGKSTWAAKFQEENEVAYISRDDIRLSFLKEGEDYFSHEKAVFRKFVAGIVTTLKEGHDIIADATHLNEFSRRKLTQAIDMNFKDYEIVYVAFHSDADTCVERNENRSGRRYVPENVIRNMCRDFIHPSLDEDERAIEIIEVSDEDGNFSDE